MRDLVSIIAFVLTFFVISVAGMLVSFVVSVFMGVLFMGVSRELGRVLLMVIMACGIGVTFAFSSKISRRLVRFLSDWRI